MNSVFKLKGFLGKDPELKSFNNKTVCNITLAEKTEAQTVWHNLECWGNLANLIAKNFKKGDLVLVDGDLLKKEDKYLLSVKEMALLPKYEKKQKITTQEIDF